MPSFRTLCNSVAVHALLALNVLSPAAANTQYSSEPGSCQIIGDSGVYGLGVRLSYYLQWAAVALGTSRAPQASARTRAATNIVTLSVLIASIHGAVANNSLMLVEWYIVQFLTFWLLLLNLPMSKVAAKEAVGSLIITLCNYIIVLSFPIYVYFHAAEQGTKDGCEPLVWLFRPILALSKSWIEACKAFAVIFVIVAVVFVLVALSLFGDQDSRNQKKNGVASTWDSEKLSVQGLQPPQPQTTGIGTTLHLGFGAVIIALVEMTIKSNNIVFSGGDLTDSSQLTPLIIGVFSLVSALWEMGRSPDRNRQENAIS